MNPQPLRDGIRWLVGKPIPTILAGLVLALAMGIHPKVVSERLGHSSVAITLDIYSHLTPGLQEDAAERPLRRPPPHSREALDRAGPRRPSPLV